MVSRNSGPPQIDEIDQKLIRLLEKDGRTTNRALASALGITEVTVASRIRRLSEKGIAQVVGILALESGGFNFSVMIGVTVKKGNSIPRVAKAIAKIEESRGVSIVDAYYDLFASVVARDQEHLKEIAESKLFSIEGIESIEFFVGIDPRPYKPEWALNIS